MSTAAAAGKPSFFYSDMQGLGLRSDGGRTKVDIGMDIVYLGFSGSDSLEAEAAAQLIRLERYAAKVFGCKLAIGLTRTDRGDIRYDVSLDVLMAEDSATLIGHGQNESIELAIGSAFDAAERALQIEVFKARGRLR